MEQLHSFDTIDTYNKTFGFETKNPLVSIIDMKKAKNNMAGDGITFSYGIYALFLKNIVCGDITYGRQSYDYQDGTITSFAPGQVVRIDHLKGINPDCIGMLFHPDLIKGTSLGSNIRQYSFFSYSSREALHLSYEEKTIFKDCLKKIEIEINHPIDTHSKKIICRNIELLLDYCMRFYERQFITRKEANQDILTKFEDLLDSYFQGNNAEMKGLPTVKYFAEKCFLSPNYFGDLIKKEIGKTPQELIQSKIIDLAKEELLSSNNTINEISYHLGFQYSQHFNRFFKRNVKLTPSEYRKQE